MQRAQVGQLKPSVAILSLGPASHKTTRASAERSDESGRRGNKRSRGSNKSEISQARHEVRSRPLAIPAQATEHAEKPRTWSSCALWVLESTHEVANLPSHHDLWPFTAPHQVLSRGYRTY